MGIIWTKIVEFTSSTKQTEPEIVTPRYILDLDEGIDTDASVAE